MDLIGERDRPSHVQQSDVAVQIFLPVVLRVDDDLIDGDDLLGVAFKPAKFCKRSRQSRSNLRKHAVH